VGDVSAALTTALLAGLLGAGAGVVVNRAAGAFPWSRPTAPALAGTVAVRQRTATAVRPPVLEMATGALFVLTTLRFGPVAELPAFLLLAAAGVLLAVIDLRHRLLPNRVVGPALAGGAVLLAAAAALDQQWTPLLRGALGAAALFVCFLVLALISPRSLGMGDVKLAALLGLYLGWLGGEVLLIGAAAGFVVQAVAALALLATGRVGLRGELPFGPAMLAGAALAIGWSGLPLG
jgi:leader peptidase (prepilin peptidase)/N-methyltransferase